MPESELGRRSGILAIIAIAAGAVVPFLAPVLVPLGTVGGLIYYVLNAGATVLLIIAAIMGWIAITRNKDRSLILLIVTIIATVLSVLSLPSLL